MNSNEIYKPITLRKYVQHCIEGNIIYSIHQREDYSWDLDQCLDYLNNLLEKRVSHIIAFCKYYNVGHLRGHKFSIGHDNLTDSPIEIYKENLKDVETFPQETVFSFDGRHKTQLLVWAICGSRVKFAKDKSPIRFYLQYKINSEGGNLKYSGIKIIAHKNSESWFLEKGNTELNILFKSVDGLLYPNIRDDLSTNLINMIESNNIKIPNITQETLANFLFAKIHSLNSNCLIYTSADISNIIAFQERNVINQSDAEISKGIRDAQKGTNWSPLEVFKNHGENILNVRGFKRSLKEQTQKFIDIGIQSKNTESFQQDVVIHSYIILNKSGIADKKIEEKCDKNSEKINDVIRKFEDVASFNLKIYEKLKRIFPSRLIDTTHMRPFSFVFSLIYHSANKNDILNAGDWIVNTSTRYFLKLLIKLSFKLIPNQGDKAYILSKIADQINSCVIKINDKTPPFNEEQYLETEDILLKFCHSKVRDFDFKRISHRDIIGHSSNKELFYHIIYGTKSEDIDFDHSLSVDESNKFYSNYNTPSQMAEVELYNKFYRDSIYNIKYLHKHENRSSVVKGNKTQKKFYIEEQREQIAREQHIDLDSIILDMTPYERMKANKIILDAEIFRKFSAYGFTPDDFNLDLPELYSVCQDDEDKTIDKITDC